MSVYMPPQPMGLFAVLVYGPYTNPDYPGEMETRVAIGLTRKQAAKLAGLLLNCPIYTKAVLVPEMIAGTWQEDGPTAGGAGDVGI